MSDQIRINGNLFSWGSIICKVDGDLFSGFNSITYGDKRERVKGYGMARHHVPRGRSAGKYTTEAGKLGGTLDAVHALREKLASLSPDKISYGNAAFLITVQYVESDLLPLHIDLVRCVIVGDTTSHEEGPDPLKGELEFDYFYILRNGLTLFDASKGLP
jgi:hypothetical protein